MQGLGQTDGDICRNYFVARRITAKKKLDNLQRMSCLGIAGAMRSTPTAALEVLYSLQPLDIQVKMEAMAGCARIRRVGYWRSGGFAGGHMRGTWQLARFGR